MNYKLCLNMIVKDESHIIEKTLQNLLKYLPFDYYVICDTGSSDNTKEIIKTFFDDKNIKGEIHDSIWKDFGSNRTEALEKAYNKSDYLFIFDADDSIHGHLKLPNPLQSDKYDLKFGKGIEYKRPLLINNRKKWKFVGVLHEYLICTDKSSDETVYIDGDYFIDSGKNGSRSNDSKKYEKDAEILKNAFEKETDYGLKCRYAFYTAQSYKDSNQVEKSITWYEKIVNELRNWVQEKYFSCLMCGDLYQHLGNTEKSHQYYLKSIEFDSSRIEGILKVCEYYQKKEQYLLAHLLASKYIDVKPQFSDKLFINIHAFNDQLDFINSISGYYCNQKESSFYSLIKILKNKKVQPHQLELSYNNLIFYKEQLKNMDNETTEFLFNDFNDFINKKNIQNKMENNYFIIWNQLFEKYKKRLTKYNNFNKNQIRNKENPIVFLSMTTCKRFHLFYQTMNSILNTWIDIDKVDYWFIVDDNSIQMEKQNMKLLYPWIDYYYKNENEKGHASSMHIIYKKLKELKPKYWIHLEDDFLFFEKMNVIEKGMKGFEVFKEQNVKQICFNRSYAETIDNYNIVSHEVINDEYAIHIYDKDKKVNVPNCYYWPNYSFRPSMIDTSAIFELGNYGNQGFIEMDYANKWTEKGYKTGFFNKLIHIHIGRLTSERHDQTKQNAYNLNQTSQFGENAKNGPISDIKKLLANEFIFIKGLDQIGNDGGFKGSIDECIIECMNNKELGGFNSLGFLKKEITELKSSNYFKEKDGIYIKKEFYTKYLLKQSNIELNEDNMSLNEDEKKEEKNIQIQINKKKKNPCIKIINLEIREDRKEGTKKKLLDVGFQEEEFEFIKATNGYELTPSREMYELFKGNDFAYRKGIVGCAYSHYYLWKQLLEDDEHEFYVIMEDDVIVEKEFKKKLMELKKDLSQKDTVFMGYHMSGTNQKKHKDIYFDSEKLLNIDKLNNDIYIGGYYCYSINKIGAKKMINYIQKNNIKHGIDYLNKINKELNSFEVQPHLVLSDWHDNRTKHNVDSNIQNNVETFDYSLYQEKPITIAFHDNCLCERGTSKALLQYAYYNQILLGNQSLIFYEKNNCNNDKSVIEKFKNNFKVFGYNSWEEVDNILKNNHSEYLFLIKYGNNDGKLSKVCKNIVQCVFSTDDKHGDYYVSINESLNKGRNIEVLPRMIILPKINKNLREKLNIPKDSIVFGRHGGYDTFNIPYVQQTIIEFAKKNPSKYFLFMNTKSFNKEQINNIIYIDKTIHENEIVEFINSCDVMIWGRMDGETFGQAIAEFSIHNKPIIATKCYEIKKMYPNMNFGPFHAHVKLLGNETLWYDNKESLYIHLDEFRKEKYQNKDLNYYKDFTPKKVMSKFKSLFIEDNHYKDEFIFIKAKDQMNNDLYFHKKPLQELMKIALDDPNCTGFNSLGYFKYEIDELKSSPFLSEKNGIYIKKDIYNNYLKRKDNKPINYDEISFITLTNNGYIDYTKNCIKSLENYNQKCPLKCYCIDDDCYNNLKNIYNHIYKINGDHNEVSDFIQNSYRNEKWGDIVLRKFDIIYENLCKFKYVLFTDGDITFEKDKFIEYCYNHIDSYDIITQNDSSIQGFNQICTGFLFINSNEVTKKYFNPKNVDFNIYRRDDQVYVNSMKENMKYKYLPKKLFPNGAYFYDYQPKDPYLIHFNCVLGHKKKDKMKYYNKWYLENNIKNIKIIGNWCSSKQLIKEWSIMNHNSPLFNSYQLVEHDENIDYYVIVNKPQDDKVYYKPSKTIVFQMEPWVEDNSKNWGVKTWGKWTKPDPNQFLHVHNHQYYLNNVQWQIEIPQTYPETRQNQVLSILSEKNFDTGHQKRIQFIQYLEKEKKEYMHVFGKENYHQFNSYQGQLKENKKENEYVNYKYVFACENNSETNYATEKIWEPILCECLTFYWGCPNLEIHIDSQAFVRLDLDDFEESMELIEKAIQEDWWSQRIDVIRKEKQRIIEELGFFPKLEKMIQNIENKTKIPTTVINL